MQIFVMLAINFLALSKSSIQESKSKNKTDNFHRKSFRFSANFAKKMPH